MKHRLRGMAWAAMLVLGMSAAGKAAAGSDYPDKPIRLVVPFTPGGITDQLARDIGNALGTRLRQTVVVDNRPGAGGNIGAAAVARAPADGYTLLFGTFGTLAVNKSLYDKPGYDPLKDLTPVGGVAYLPNVLLVHPGVPANNVAELVALAKKSPARLTYGSFGNGSSAHLAGELLAHMAGIEITHVPYKGSAPAMTDLLGGRLTMIFDSIPTALPMVRDGRARALAVTTEFRSDQLPNVPTVATTIRGYELTAWFGIAAPAATPKHVIDRLNTELAAALKDPAFRERLSKQGAVAFPSTPAQFGDYIRNQYEKWDKVIKTANIRLD
ncbi:tripartite tricarboxylate transporter substrate binding protein [Cupriavidus sp. IK-TO18]|uniref:Bug family tripartite tricarboxylate transporter substrate binding protein n=1 Tax=Cupriavidus sp. IK-TO18 TaxID=2782182 RepID=UPI00189AA2D9|nr:tripartite tricarboxylate transporter substrate binding protein [Cupriavidus sp. IK-TO18]MBF6990814.1 tripartite tricarboxylate transporter substrate binding protein [Cupriavidus sp. IK-TO18]